MVEQLPFEFFFKKNPLRKIYAGDFYLEWYP